MTADEIREHTALKYRAAAKLERNFAAWMREFRDVMGTDVRLGGYVRSVATDTDGHNLYEILSIIRFFGFCGRYRWDADAVRKFIRFYQTLRFSGVSGRRRYELTPVQVFQFASVFGFRAEDGARLCRTFYLFVPRKYSKTTSAASLAVYDMLFGDNNAQAYVGANSYPQAKICFDEIRALMRDIDPSEKHFRINREKITFKDKGRDSFAQCLTANAKTQDGLNASLVIMDEYAQARNSAAKNGADLKNVLTSSMGARREPLTVIISTASEVVDGPFAHELEGVKRILRGETENDSVFASLFMPDPGDLDGDPRTWRKVQPHIGVTVREDFYAKEWETAKLSAENMLTFRTKLLNVFAVKETRTWITANEIRDLFRHLEPERLKTPPVVMIAFDLSVWDDLSAVCYEYYLKESDTWHFSVDYYIPADTVAVHPRRELYRRWIETGQLHALPGNVIDYGAIAQDMIAKKDTLRIMGIGYDPYHSKQMVNMLSAAGASGVLTSIKQTYGAFTPAVEALEILIKTKKCTFEPNEITAWCFGNCVMDEDRLGNRKPVKARADDKIDGAVCCIMTQHLFMIK